jgi:hypothetical protein
MFREEAIALIMTGLLAAGACPREQARAQAEHLLDEYLQDPAYRVEGVDVPEEFVADLLAHI